jgi:predicted house-cleaning noncanonical NTP pyrophosphatase (MazG superfamily)
MAERGRRRLVKLVRSRVGQFIGGDSKVTYEVVPKVDHVRLLRAKLMKEATEHLLDPSVDELADVFEVVRCLVKVEGRGTIDDVILRANQKREERGDFMEAVGMYCTTTAAPKSEGGHG